MNIPNNNNAAEVVVGLNSHTIGLFVKDVGGGKKDTKEDRRGKECGEIGGREVARGPIEDGRQTSDPFERYRAIRRPRKSDVGARNRGLSHGRSTPKGEEKRRQPGNPVV